MKLSDNLKKIRKENNLSQEQLAEMLGVSRQAVSKWESGQSYPEMDKVLLICKLFNYNIDELMNENIKEVDETKQSKNIINKYVEDFFAFITKTVDMFSSMKFRQRLKCLMEQVCVALFLFIVFAIIGSIALSVVHGIFGRISANVYYVIKDILKSIYIVFALVLGTIILLHIFKIRYLDYYEIVKEDDIDDEKREIREDFNKEQAEENDSKIKKVFIEKKKEKVIIRDPDHSQSKFLTGLFRIILAIIKFMAICVAMIFVVTFIGLFCLLVISFMFVKAGFVFWGSLFAIISAIIVNFIILELFYNFLLSKKSKRTRMAISFVVALILAGISIGMIFIGVTQFTIIEDNSSSFEIEEVYEYEMKDNLLIDSWNCAYKYIETDSNDIKIVVKHTKFTGTYIYDGNEKIEIHCSNDGKNFIEFIRTIINDINNKELKDYPVCAEVCIYTSKENIEKLVENQKEYYKQIQEEDIELNDLNNTIIELENQINLLEEENSELTNMIEDKDSIILDKEQTIQFLEETIQEYDTN